MLRVEDSNMAASSTVLEPPSSSRKEDEPSLKEIHTLLVGVQN